MRRVGPSKAKATQLPRVVLHTAVSADGRIDWFAPDLGKFYGVISRWREDLTLVGSETALAAHAGPPDAFDGPVAQPAAGDTRPWLAIVDSAGRFRNYSGFLAAGYWRGAIALCSRATPRDHIAYLETRRIPRLVAGEARVDLRAALARLGSRFGVKVVRVDSGGTLGGVLLRAGLVTEVSVLVHPVLIGGTSARSFYRAADLTGPEGAIPLRLTGVDDLGDGIAWLRYEVARPGAAKARRPRVSRSTAKRRK